MDEQLRHQYLEAMGISSWLPRQQLSGARATPDWVFEFTYPDNAVTEAGTRGGVRSSVHSASSAPLATPAEVKKAAAQARSDLAASIGGLDPAADKVKTKPGMKPAATPSEAVAGSVDSAAPVSTDSRFKAAEMVEQRPDTSIEVNIPEVRMPNADSQHQEPFKLAFIAYQDCLVVDSLPPRSRQGVSPQHQILLDKILRSIGLLGGAAADQFMLPWPMFASRSLDQGAEQARLTVQHKLAKSLQHNKVSQVILLGEAAARMVLERDEPLDQLRGMLFSLRSDVKTLASASLTEMIAVPGCKRDVWRDLQPLLEHIEATGNHD
ncbi:hypothetical protein [Amphritea sp. HPY]|uniref:hypothetical protein n=1 Tax=Amphritea sp. HPY TaxID=3421652 RepID=UPI003D7E957A